MCMGCLSYNKHILKHNHSSENQLIIPVSRKPTYRFSFSNLMLGEWGARSKKKNEKGKAIDYCSRVKSSQGAASAPLGLPISVELGVNHHPEDVNEPNKHGQKTKHLERKRRRRGNNGGQLWTDITRALCIQGCFCWNVEKIWDVFFVAIPPS